MSARESGKITLLHSTVSRQSSVFQLAEQRVRRYGRWLIQPVKRQEALCLFDADGAWVTLLRKSTWE